MKANIQAFKMPRYHEIPDIGLYLEQTIKYINEVLYPLGCIEVTSSMVSNYVKKGYIDRPVKKQYSAEQIARLFFLVMAKQVLSMENIVILFEMQKASYSSESAYNRFCDEMEETLRYMFAQNDDTIDANMLETPDTPENKILRSVVIAVSQIIYLNHCFEMRQEELKEMQCSDGRLLF